MTSDEQDRIEADARHRETLSRRNLVLSAPLMLSAIVLASCERGYRGDRGTRRRGGNGGDGGGY